MYRDEYRPWAGSGPPPSSSSTATRAPVRVHAVTGPSTSRADFRPGTTIANLPGAPPAGRQATTVFEHDGAFSGVSSYRAEYRPGVSSYRAEYRPMVHQQPPPPSPASSSPSTSATRGPLKIPFLGVPTSHDYRYYPGSHREPAIVNDPQRRTGSVFPDDNAAGAWKSSARDDYRRHDVQRPSSSAPAPPKPRLVLPFTGQSTTRSDFRPVPFADDGSSARDAGPARRRLDDDPDVHVHDVMMMSAAPFDATSSYRAEFHAMPLEAAANRGAFDDDDDEAGDPEIPFEGTTESRSSYVRHDVAKAIPARPSASAFQAFDSHPAASPFEGVSEARACYVPYGSDVLAAANRVAFDAAAPPEDEPIPFEGTSVHRADYRAPPPTTTRSSAPATRSGRHAAAVDPISETPFEGQSTSRADYVSHPMAPAARQPMAKALATPAFDGASTARSDYPAPHRGRALSQPTTAPADSTAASSSSSLTFEGVSESRASYTPMPLPGRETSAFGTWTRVPLTFDGESVSRSDYRPVPIDELRQASRRVHHDDESGGQRGPAPRPPFDGASSYAVDYVPIALDAQRAREHGQTYHQRVPLPFDGVTETRASYTAPLADATRVVRLTTPTSRAAPAASGFDGASEARSAYVAHRLPEQAAHHLPQGPDRPIRIPFDGVSEFKDQFKRG
ncbi:hypothetical protein PBRA_005840 [Plasmodiophora brassicae]|nr:hypothetical protein PBRA_005840 [Plasmodiophora brassicae]